jgi:hypothetical protein
VFGRIPDACIGDERTTDAHAQLGALGLGPAIESEVALAEAGARIAIGLAGRGDHRILVRAHVVGRS